MILVSGAGGKTGQAVVAALRVRGAAVRAWLRTARPQPPGVSVFVGDLTSPAGWAAACDGVTAIYHICPNMHADELAIGDLAIAAAQAAGVGRFVYHSVLHPHTAEMPHHWAKLQVEARLFQSGPPFVILQPTAYMQNIRAQWPAIREGGHYTVPYAVSAPISLIDLYDVAAVAARVLTEPGFDYATFELAGTPPLSQTAVAEILAGVAGRPVQAVEQPRDGWRADAEARGMPPFAIDTLLKMFDYYDRWGLPGNPTVLTALLGRLPATLNEVARRW